MLSGHLGKVVIAGAAGMAADDIVSSDVTLITVLTDASSSIAGRGLEQAVRAGQNLLLDVFAALEAPFSAPLAARAAWIPSVHQLIPIVGSGSGVSWRMRIWRRDWRS